MGIQTHYGPFDILLEHWAAGGSAVTADDVTVGSIIDQTAAVRTEYRTLIRVEAIDVTTGDEFYNFTIQLSNTADMSTGIKVAARCYLGSDSVIGETADTAAGDIRELIWNSEIAGTAYRYWRLGLDVGGTSPSITYHAYTTRVN